MKICFVSKNIYPVASDNGVNFAGGAEIQLLMLAKKFKEMGHEVAFITDDFGQSAVEKIDGIKYFKSPFRYMGGPKFRLLTDWYLLFKRLKKVDADVYLLKGPRFNLFIAGLFAVRTGKRVVFISTTDTDSDPDIMRRIDPVYTRVFYRVGLRMIPIVVCQTVHQETNFRRYFRKEAVYINNTYSINPKVSKSQAKKEVLWVGTNSNAKRPRLFLDFAGRTDEITYKMAMVPSENAMMQKSLEKEILEAPNIEYLGFVPENEMEKIYTDASVLVNFSELEGFPNVFLHAWAHRTPVVSLSINPDSIIDKYRMGFCSGSIEQMIKDVRSLFQNDQLRIEMGNNGHEYVKREHDADKIAEQYINLFKEVNK